MKWNVYRSKIESGEVEWEAVYRKKSRQLERYNEQFKEQANATLAMLPIHREHADLRRVLQQVATGKLFDDSVGEVVPTPAPQKGSGTGVGGVEEGGSAGGSGDILRNNSAEEMIHMMGSDEEGGVESSAGLSVTAPKEKSKNRPQMRHECGHRKQEDEYQALHRHARVVGGVGFQCQVPVEERRHGGFRTGRKFGEGGLKRFDVCECAKCKPVTSIPAI